MLADSDGIRIAYEVTGSGAPVVLLHGFPDSGSVWQAQVGPLAQAGFQVVVPDLRGYGASDKPSEVGAYSLLAVAGDVLAVLDDLGVERCHVAGHDWGAALAWVMGCLLPDRVDHLVALSVGHPAAFRAVGYEQQMRSWYMLLFQFPGVAERWLADDGWANLRNWAGHPDTDEVVARLEGDGSLTPALNWYRANVPPESWIAPPLELPLVQAPTLGVWSTGDFALTEQQMVGSGEFVSGPWRYERLEGVGHWMQREAPDRVNQLLVEFLTR